MSSTTRGGDYDPLGAYYTRPDDARRCVQVLPIEPGERILEPSVGGGSFLRALYALGLVDAAARNVEVMDLNPQAPGLHMPGDHLRTVARDTGLVVLTGFLVTAPQQRPDWVLGNPPYGTRPPAETCPRCAGAGEGCRRCRGEGEVRPAAVHVATAHCRRALAITRRHVAFLLSLGFLESLRRAAFWSWAPLRRVWIFPDRLSYFNCPACSGTGVAGPRWHPSGWRWDAAWASSPCSCCGGSGRHPDRRGTDSQGSGLFWFDRRWTAPPTLHWMPGGTSP